MHMSTANLTIAQVERWRSQGYNVTIKTEEGLVEVCKNVPAPKPAPEFRRPTNTAPLSWWHDKD